MCFRGQVESIDHLFLECQVTRFVWTTISCAFGIRQRPSSMQQLHTWVCGFPLSIRASVTIGMVALCWSRNCS